jgi:hypothetical protein
MAFIDASMNFGSTAITSSTADTVSTNVFDAGNGVATTKRLFDGAESAKVAGRITLSAGTSPTVRARLVGADNAALTTNPTILADTGVISVKADGSTALANTDTVYFQMEPAQQHAAKRYYGMMFTLGGTTPSATCDARLVLDSQSNMRGLQAAVPAT